MKWFLGCGAIRLDVCNSESRELLTEQTSSSRIVPGSLTMVFQQGDEELECFSWFKLLSSGNVKV